MIELRAYMTRTNLILGQMLTVLCASGVADGQKGVGETIRIALRERQTMMDSIAERLKGLEVRSRAVGDVLDARIRKNRALLGRLGGRMGAS